MLESHILTRWLDILEAFCVTFVLHDSVRWQVEDTSQRVSNAISGGLIICSAIPHGYNIFL